MPSNQQTQRRPNVFTQQVALRSYENRVLQYAFRDVLPTLGLDYDLGYNTHPANWEGEGKFTMTFCACDRYVRKGPVKIDWCVSCIQVCDTQICLWKWVDGPV